MRRLVTLIALLFCCLSFSFAQLSDISITRIPGVSTIGPDSVVPLQDMNLRFRLINLDSGVAVTMTSLKIFIQSSPLLRDSFPITSGGGFFTIPSFGFLDVEDTIPASLSAMQDGVNVLIIWPQAPEIMAVDSLRDTIYMNDTTTLREPDLNGNSPKFLLGPNPTTGKVYLIPEQAKYRPNIAILYDRQGKMIRRYNEFEDGLDLNGISKGLYLLEVEYGAGFRQSFRVIKQE